MSDSISLPIIITSAGVQPQAPADLRAAIVDYATGINPGITTELPGSLIEDMVSTATGAAVVCDQARVELINSLTPYAANDYLLNQLGVQYGFQQGVEQNTNVYLVFSGTSGFVIQPGFLVGDGTYQYSVIDGGIISGTGTGSSLPLYAVATTAGTFTVAANTVNQLGTSVPVTVTLSATNPEPGTPGGIAQTSDQYRAVVLEGIRVPCIGTPSALKTALVQVPGVQIRLVSFRLVTGGYQIICGGGDPYQVAYAIYNAIPDIALLQGSSINSARNVVTTVIDSPDTYQIVFVNPPEQTVFLVLTWNTNAVNFVSVAAVQQLGNAALVAYINGIVAGQPIILFQMEQAFINSLVGVIPANNITRLVFSISVNGSPLSPISGTGEFVGDPEGYFNLSPTNVEITLG